MLRKQYDHQNSTGILSLYVALSMGLKYRTSCQVRETPKQSNLNIKRIFLVLDNASIHKSKKTKEALLKNHPRITLVFLPTKSPKILDK
jgi:hypothetical protein